MCVFSTGNHDNSTSSYSKSTHVKHNTRLQCNGHTASNGYLQSTTYTCTVHVHSHFMFLIHGVFIVYYFVYRRHTWAQDFRFWRQRFDGVPDVTSAHWLQRDERSFGVTWSDDEATWWGQGRGQCRPIAPHWRHWWVVFEVQIKFSQIILEVFQIGLIEY